MSIPFVPGCGSGGTEGLKSLPASIERDSSREYTCSGAAPAQCSGHALHGARAGARKNERDPDMSRHCARLKLAQGARDCARAQCLQLRGCHCDSASETGTGNAAATSETNTVIAKANDHEGCLGGSTILRRDYHTYSSTVCYMHLTVLADK